jgi:hypothetical protein
MQGKVSGSIGRPPTLAVEKTVTSQHDPSSKQGFAENAGFSLI